MRSDIKPGGTFPDYALPDHTNTVRKLSELQGDDPLVLTLARGNYCPKEHQQHLELAANYPKIAVAYTQIVTISTDDHHTHPRVPRLGRRPVDVPLRSRSDDAKGSRHPGVHRPRARSDDPPHAGAQAGTGHSPRLQRLLVLGTAVVLRLVADLCAVSSEIRPDWDLSKPGLREAWDAGDYSNFHGWNKRAPQSMPTSYES